MIKKLREQIKKIGYSNRQVSVREESGSYSTCINIIIKDLSVNKKNIERIAKEHEDIDRCVITGEVLNGGNTIILVDYDYNTLANFKNNELRPLAEELVKYFEDNRRSKDSLENIMVHKEESKELFISHDLVWIKNCNEIKFTDTAAKFYSKNYTTEERIWNTVNALAFIRLNN